MVRNLKKRELRRQTLGRPPVAVRTQQRLRQERERFPARELWNQIREWWRRRKRHQLRLWWLSRG